jgi:hypothetical protein
MPLRSEPGTRLELEARFVLLSAEIQQLRLLGSDDPRRDALGPKIDEAAELLERIGELIDQQQPLADQL